MIKVRVSRLISRILPLMAIMSALSLPAVFTGCGGNTVSTLAPTISVSSSPASISSGSSSTLTVSAANATAVTVTGSDGSSYTMPLTGGTQKVTPTATTTYTATAAGTSGSVSATTTVTVTGTTSSKPTVTISAAPTSITAGGSSTLTVTATNSDSVAVTGTDGSSYTLKASGGTQSVNPSVTTTYTATSTGAGGTATATAIVTVTANTSAPTVTITAKPATIVSGSSSTLTVVATNATGVTVTGTDGSSYTLPVTGGTQAVTPTATTTYTATATGAGGKVTETAVVTVTAPVPTVTISASPSIIVTGNSSTLTVVATNATGVTVTGTDASSYTLSATGGTQVVNPAATTTYTATATGAGGTVTATAILTVNAVGSVQSVDHVIFMLQENHTFDNYFGMLNPYRKSDGKNWNVGDDGVDYEIDGIDDKLTTSNPDDAGTNYPLFKLKSTCIDDESSDWLASYGDVNRYNFDKTRPIQMNGFVHNAEGYADNCYDSGTCSGNFTDLTGQRAMGYYDEQYLNYYYYMASQFAVSNRWFSPVSDKSISNRIATFTGGTTQGLVLDPTNEDHTAQLPAEPIFQKLDKAHVTWKIYYTATVGLCLADEECKGSGDPNYPATDFSEISYSYNFLRQNPTHSLTDCGTLQPSSVVGDTTNSFCVDPTHIVPLSYYYNDLMNNTLPSFAFIEAGYGNNDEHPGSGQSVLTGQAEVSKVVNAFMQSSSWSDSVFFLAYDEGGGPYEHVPPVPGHSNDKTDAMLGALPSTSIPDISTIAVNPDGYNPCLPTAGVPITNCDLKTSDPGAVSTDAPAQEGFAAQLGFRVPNMVISPFTRRHYVSNIPMDHTAVIRFVEDRFIGDHTYLTNRDAAQPNLLDFFDFNGIPWATPPTPPTPVPVGSTCTPTSMGP
jgi:phospholipase C